MLKVLRFAVLGGVFIIARALYGQELPNDPGFTRKDYGEVRYPRAMFVVEASALAAAVAQDGRRYSREEYYVGNEERHRSAAKYAAVNVPIALAAAYAGWRLEGSRRKGLRVLGHVIMWSAVGAYSADYFRAH